MTDNGGGSLVSKRHDYGEDCSSCRLVSGAGMVGLSVYVLTAAKKQKTIFSRNVIYCISFGVFSVGIARLLALPPFQKTITN